MNVSASDRGANADTIDIDARIVAEGLGIAPEEVEPRRRAGNITSLCERGTGQETGLVRVTFYLGKRRLRLVVDPDGSVLQQEPAPDQPSAIFTIGGESQAVLTRIKPTPRPVLESASGIRRAHD